MNITDVFHYSKVLNQISKSRVFVSAIVFIIGKDTMLYKLKNLFTLAGDTVLKFMITLTFVQQVVISQKSKNHEKVLDVF